MPPEIHACSITLHFLGIVKVITNQTVGQRVMVAMAISGCVPAVMHAWHREECLGSRHSLAEFGRSGGPSKDTHKLDNVN